VRVGDVADFRVITKDAGEGVLKATVKGPDGYELPLRCNKVNPTTYECGYNPTKTGPHQVHITYGGIHIPKSPFNVDVGAYRETLIRAYGPGLEGGVVGYPADFIVETNGETGSLGFSIEGPSQARIDCVDNLDGSANVTYWPTAVGEYAVHILCDGEDVPASPYMAWIEQKGNYDPTLVKIYGPGVDKETPLVINRPTEFTVDCREAGEAPLKVTITDADYQKLDVYVKNNGNNTYTCRYTPIYPNRHTIFVTYGSVAIPKSPVRVSL
jgi:filamin